MEPKTSSETHNRIPGRASVSQFDRRDGSAMLMVRFIGLSLPTQLQFREALLKVVIDLPAWCGGQRVWRGLMDGGYATVLLQTPLESGDRVDITVQTMSNMSDNSIVGEPVRFEQVEVHTEHQL